MADNDEASRPMGAPQHGLPTTGPNPMNGPTTCVSACELKDLIADDLYKVLCKHFLMKGKGRRPDLPLVKVVTNKLLLQLFFLREEADTSYRELKSWLERLVPSTASVTESRMYHKISAVYNASLKMTQDSVESYIEETFDFNELSQPLACLQLSRLHLINYKPYEQPPLEDVTNNVVIALEHFRSGERESPIFVRKWLKKLSLACSHLSDTTLKSKVKATLKTYTDLKNKKNTEGLDLDVFMKRNFINTGSSNFSHFQVQEANNSQSCKKCSELEESVRHKTVVITTQEKEREKLLNCIENLNFELKIKDEHFTESEKSKEDLTVTLSTLNSEISKWKKEVKKMREDNTDLAKKLEDISNTKLYYKRNIELKREVEDLKGKLHQLTSDNSALLLGIDSEVNMNKDLKQKVKLEQTLKSKYKKEVETLKEEKERYMHALHSLKEDEGLNLKENKYNAYAYHVRQLYMSLIGEASVVPAQASKVVQLVARHLFKKDLTKDELPSSSTCINFMDEGHHIAKQQIVERMQASNNFTFASDGTSRQKTHFMEHHIVLDNGATLSIGFSEVPDDKAETLFTKSIDLLEELSDTYVDAEDHAERAQVFIDILSKMKCLMSDRAANMKLFNKKMLEFKKDAIGSDASIEFLYCNAHFLIALADATEKAIKTQEDFFSVRLGRDIDAAFNHFSSSSETAAFRLIRTAADVFGPRGDEKNGCREEWLAHCDLVGVKSKFTSYRSNRFNNIFENATAILHHREECLSFLNTYVSHSNLKLRSICLDLQDERIISVIRGISLFSLLVTTPYWTLMNSSTPYGRFPTFVQDMDAALVRWSDEEFQIEEIWNENALFGEFAPSTFDKSHHEFIFSSSITSSTFKLICKKSSEAVRRQLNDFLPGGVYGGDIPPDLQKVLDACPLTNLTGERMFGDLDYDMVKRRRANTFLRSTLSMWKHNRTGTFLEKKSPGLRQKIMSSAKKHGKRLKVKHKQAVKDVRESIRQRLQENKRQKIEKELKDKDRQAALLTDLLQQGGLCNTKEDLDKLMHSPRPLQKLKVELRFRKYYMNASDIRLSGNLCTLYRALCNHLGFEYDQETPLKKRKIDDLDSVSESECSDTDTHRSPGDSEEERDSQLDQL